MERELMFKSGLGRSIDPISEFKLVSR